MFFFILALVTNSTNKNDFTSLKPLVDNDININFNTPLNYNKTSINR